MNQDISHPEHPERPAEPSVLDVIDQGMEDALDQSEDELLQVDEDELVDEWKGQVDSEADAEEVKKLRLLNLDLRNRIRRAEQDQRQRTLLLVAFLGLTFLWTGYLMWIVGWQSSLSDEVVIVLMGSATANVFGFMYIAARYLFHRPMA